MAVFNQIDDMIWFVDGLTIISTCEIADRFFRPVQLVARIATILGSSSPSVLSQEKP
jgi:hypothetical protein